MTRLCGIHYNLNVCITNTMDSFQYSLNYKSQTDTTHTYIIFNRFFAPSFPFRTRDTHTGGNFGNKFTIDARTGALTARSLDRESHARFQLQISAHDHGTPVTYRGTCNITVTVEDQNDNDPRFELPRYEAKVAEDAPIGAAVLTVKATDADLGINARIVYSLSNETEWLFSIDNRSGLITTAG